MSCIAPQNKSILYITTTYFELRQVTWAFWTVTNRTKWVEGSLQRLLANIEEMPHPESAVHDLGNTPAIFGISFVSWGVKQYRA